MRFPYLPAIAVLTFLFAGCSMPSIALVPRVGQLDVEGDFSVSESAGGGALKVETSADEDELGLDDETVFQPRIDLDWDDFHIWINAMRPEYSGNGELTTDLTIFGQTFTAGTPVSSDWEFGYYTVSAVYDIIPTGDAVDIGIGAGVGMITWDVEIASRTAPLRRSTDDDLGFAFLTARVATEISRFALLGQISGASVDWDDEDISFFEVDLSGGYKIFDTKSCDGTVLAGYRFLNVDYEWEDGGSEVEVDADFYGPYLGFMLRF
jgi:hypothetical protein